MNSVTTKKSHHSHHRKANFGSFVKSLSHGIRDVEKPIADVYTTGIKEVGSVSNGLVKASGGILSSLGLPLLIVGGVVLVVMIKNK